MSNHFLEVRSLGQKIANSPFLIRVGLSSLLILVLAASNLGRIKGTSAALSPRPSLPPQNGEIMVSVDETVPGSQYRHAEWQIDLPQLTAEINAAVSNLSVDGRLTADISELLGAQQSSMNVLIYDSSRPVTIRRIGGNDTYETGLPGVQYQRLGNQLGIIKAGEALGWLTVSGAANSTQENYIVAALLISLGAQFLQTEFYSAKTFENVARPIEVEQRATRINGAAVNQISSGALKVGGGVGIGLVGGMIVADIIRDKALDGCVACCKNKFRGQAGVCTATYSFLGGCRCTFNGVTAPCP